VGSAKHRVVLGKGAAVRRGAWRAGESATWPSSCDDNDLAVVMRRQPMLVVEVDELQLDERPPATFMKWRPGLVPAQASR